MKTSLIILCCCAVLAQINAGEPGHILPVSGVTPDTPSLETAFKDAMFIERTADPSGMINYMVRIYDPKVVADGGFMSNDVVLVVGDSNRRAVASAPLQYSGVCTTSPSKTKFISFNFSVHKDFDRYTVVNIGTYNGKNVFFRPYRLPAKSTPHPTAEQAADGKTPEAPQPPH
jgi:hypothetical protein